jgi:hypothetical protein
MPMGVTFAVILLLGALSAAQCSGRVSAEHRAERAEKAQKAAEANLTTCHKSEVNLQTELSIQKAAVAALKADGDRREAEIAKARQAARSEAARADHAIDVLAHAQPTGVDACARTLDAVRIARGAR